MKRTIHIFISSLMFLGITVTAYLHNAEAAGTNLILNPSAETASGTAPANWSEDYWGSNTRVFQYAAGGYDGTKSLYVKLSNFVDGDAKWSHDLVSVTPNTSYVFSDYYKSTATTYFIARYLDASNNESYIDIGQTASAANWTKYNITFKTPATATKMTMLHLLASNGELWTDNYSLVPATVTTPTPTQTPSATPTATKTPTPTPTQNPSSNLVPNNSFEQTSGSLPAGWDKNTWGSNTATFAYLSTGHTGSRSTKVTVSNYKDGDAKWSFNPVSITPGGYYRFTDYYQSNISTEVAMWIVKQDGTEDYLPLHNAPVSNGVWAKYTAAFRVPNDAVKLSVMHFVAMNGFLITDDHSLTTETPRTFSRPLVSLTFDDGWEQNDKNALPKLEAYGFKSTQCFATKYIEGSGQEAKVKAFVSKGHETCSHSVTHPDMTTLSNSQLTYELQHSQQYLETLAGKGNITTFAAPFGSYNDKAFTYAQKYYNTYRTTDAGFNTRDNFDFYNVKVQNILNTTTAAEVQAWVKQAQQENTWLVLLYHVITTSPDQYDTTPALFDQQLKVIKDSGITVLTYKDALNEVKAQL